ncbi:MULTISPECIES: type II toxin-antitoxin system Phd/YefM family antitoxin [unclassified Inquilinus]|uniref:type II toxin-antitoxin system Phd/YefM family antitoxin n=1 Tax=unclassified Inquilinus TaxID=2645927 RepID=UPI003F8E978E
MNWQLQDAKNRFIEVVEKALTEGPQHITRCGRPAVVVIAEAEYQKLRKPSLTFVDHLLAMPKVDIEFERMNPPPRVADL